MIHPVVAVATPSLHPKADATRRPLPAKGEEKGKAFADIADVGFPLARQQPQTWNVNLPRFVADLRGAAAPPLRHQFDAAFCTTQLAATLAIVGATMIAPPLMNQIPTSFEVLRHRMSAILSPL